MVRFLAGYSFLHYWAGLVCLKRKHGRRYDAGQFRRLSVTFGSGVGACTGIVELFKHLLHVRAHPRFFRLVLRALMGACPGHYAYGVDKPLLFLCGL